MINSATILTLSSHTVLTMCTSTCDSFKLLSHYVVQSSHMNKDSPMFVWWYYFSLGLYTSYFIIVAVPGRNRTLFCCVFRPCYRAFEALSHSTSVKGGAHTRCVDISFIDAVSLRMSPALNESTVLQCFERSNVVEIHNRIMFDFYLGLPKLFSFWLWNYTWCSLCYRLVRVLWLWTRLSWTSLEHYQQTSTTINQMHKGYVYFLVVCLYVHFFHFQWSVPSYTACVWSRFTSMFIDHFVCV